jgi:hypothetical protein
MEKVCENGSPISDGDGSLYRIGNSIVRNVIHKKNHNKMKGTREA